MIPVDHGWEGGVVQIITFDHRGRGGGRDPLKCYAKQDQGSKAPSRDHPNSSFMTRLDYIRVED